MDVSRSCGWNPGGILLLYSMEQYCGQFWVTLRLGVCVQSMRLLLVVRLLADWFSFLFFYIVSYTIFSLFLSIHWLFYYYKYLYSERRSELLFRWALVTKCLVTELSTVDESSFAGKSRPVKNATSDIGLESLWREVESRLSYCNIFVLSIRPFS
jgi:hypothetical protein